MPIHCMHPGPRVKPNSVYAYVCVCVWKRDWVLSGEQSPRDGTCSTTEIHRLRSSDVSRRGWWEFNTQHPHSLIYSTIKSSGACLFAIRLMVQANERQWSSWQIILLKSFLWISWNLLSPICLHAKTSAEWQNTTLNAIINLKYSHASLCTLLSVSGVIKQDIEHFNIQMSHIH